MLTDGNCAVVRTNRIETGVAVCGGGLAGVCAAISAARHGADVVLIQDRPVLGGNSSSEIRVGIKGARGKDDKETGIIEELELENIYRNPSRRYPIWDDILLSAVLREKRIVLMLNSSVDGVSMSSGRIASVSTWNTTAMTRTFVFAKMFIDCTGDGILRLSGAKFCKGRESSDEYGETFQTSAGDSMTMGNTILIQLRRTEADRPFRAPEWAYKFTETDFPEPGKGKNVLCNGMRVNCKRAEANDNSFWWVEYGGMLDTIGDANRIQLELKKIAYGAWDYIRNHPDGRGKGWELAWIGSLPGKRESIRYVGAHMLTQGEILKGGKFPDVVAYGGWTFDDHDPMAFWNSDHISVEHVAPSPFGIPLGCLYSANIGNLMFAGRDISVTHMALASTRVMGTCALLGQAAGTAAAMSLRENMTIADFHRERIAELQAALEDDDVMLPGRIRKPSNLMLRASLTADAEVLTNGIDRCYAGSDNGVWISRGNSVGCRWDSPICASGVRIVFDTNLRRPRRMPKQEGVLPEWTLPSMLAKSFRVEGRLENGPWKILSSVDENWRRLVRLAFPVECVDEIRLVIEDTWGGGNAHVFALDLF